MKPDPEPLITMVITVRKKLIGYTVDGHWCPTQNTRDKTIEARRQVIERQGFHPVVRTPG